jgi:hypothetical protein
MKTRAEACLQDVKVLRREVSQKQTENNDADEFIRIRGKITEGVDDARLFYFAAAPADKRQSFSGSGLPFSDADQAFFSSPNVGSVKLSGDNGFDIEIVTPNAYYVGLGSQYVPPTLHVWYTKGGKRKDAAIKVNNGIPFRMLTYPMLSTRPRDGPMFYKAEPVFARTQEQILRDSGYPSKQAIQASYAMPPNFWGLKPPF